MDQKNTEKTHDFLHFLTKNHAIKVEWLKKELSEGRYQVQSYDIAAKLLAFSVDCAQSDDQVFQAMHYL